MEAIYIIEFITMLFFFSLQWLYPIIANVTALKKIAEMTSCKIQKCN